MDTDIAAIVWGLVAAASWGAGDFSGGLATKRSSVFAVVILSQIVGGILLLLLAWFVGEQLPSQLDVFWGAAAGIAGAIGVAALYRGLATGRMAVVAPVTAVVAASVPVLVSIVLEGWPSVSQFVGLTVALVAVWFVSRDGDELDFQWRNLTLPLVAGLGFGLFFILMDRVSTGHVLWPLVAARVASVVVMTLFSWRRRQWQTPALRHLPLIALAGFFDTGGNGFFTLATQAGRLDVAAVLSSLYPVVTVLLAWLILREPLSRRQSFGVLVAVAAVVLITV